MAIYRQIYMSFWDDPKVADEFSPEDKYFYLYLLTNPHTNICGCYEISTKRMERETGYNTDTISRLLERMSSVHDVIRYDPKTKEVLLLNWYKYNWTKSPKLLQKVREVSEHIKNDTFKTYINTLLDGDYTVSIPYTYGMDTSVAVTVTDTVTVTDSVNSKKVDKFEEWWKHYPRKIGKEAARRAFAKVKVDTQILIDAVELQKGSEQWTKENGRYIPNPATWLNQGRWEDEVKTVREMKKTDLKPTASDAERMAQILERVRNG